MNSILRVRGEMPRTRPKRKPFGLVGLVIMLVIGAACQKYRPPESTILLAYLDGLKLKFTCLNSACCPRTVDLSALMQPYEARPVLQSVFWTSPTSVLAVLDSWTAGGAVLSVNPETNQVRYVILPPTIDPRLITIAHGSVIVGSMEGKVYIITQDLSIKEVDLKRNAQQAGIVQLIEAPQGKVIALQGSTVEEGGKAFVRVFMIDVSSGEVQSRLLSSPGFERLESAPGGHIVAGTRYDTAVGGVVSISEDLRRLYYLYLLGQDDNRTVLTLGRFDAESQQEETSTSDSHCTAVGLIGYAQYQGALYSSRRTTEGSTEPTLVDMDTLKPIMDLRGITQGETTTRLLVSPFGDGFLLGTNSRVIQVSADGAVVAERSLPAAWLNRDYVIADVRQ